MIAHRNLNIDEQLVRPIYGPIQQGNFVRYFRFEDQLDIAAEWLGLSTPLSQEDATNQVDKPILTQEQENIVKQIYANDLTLWQSLQQ
jgi:hypothetical protein